MDRRRVIKWCVGAVEDPEISTGGFRGGREVEADEDAGAYGVDARYLAPESVRSGCVPPSLVIIVCAVVAINEGRIKVNFWSANYS